jgi:hypothetical protein
MALAGALSPKPAWRWRPKPARWIGTVALLGALGLAGVSRPHVFSQRPGVDAGIHAGTVDPAGVMPWRPLDGRLHGLWARQSALERNWELARARAEVAMARRPGNVDPWLVHAAALSELGAPQEEVDRSMARGLALLHDPPDEELVKYLLERYREPEALARLCPPKAKPWQLLVDALLPVSPKHADALAAARHQQAPDDPAPLYVRHRLAMQAGTPGLALHHARLLRARVPEQAAAHLAVAAALRGFTPPRLKEMEQALEYALRESPLVDDRARGDVEEELVRTLIDRGDNESIARARELAVELLRRPAARKTRRRRELLTRRLPEERRGGGGSDSAPGVR